jgi:predicted permease
MYSDLIPVILPVLICIGIGYGWAKSGIPFEREFVTRAAMNVGAPCLILDGVGVLGDQASGFYLMIGIAFLATLMVGIPAALMLLVSKQPIRSYLPVAMNGNVGNLGLPLCLFAFGQEGLSLALGFYVVGCVVQFVGGPLIQGRQPAWRTLLRTPMIYATLVGLVLVYTDQQLPESLSNTVGLLGGILIPLMVMALGHALGTFGIARPGIATVLSIMRLSLGLLAGVLLAEVFSLEGTQRGIVIIETAMPVAVFNYLLASRYDRHPDVVAGSIVISTLVSLLTLPVLLSFALP